ncbi:DUF2089 family protein [Sphingobacterium sp. HJSM2_6]|uniref:DUF2089 family protein n=1 Tax=Sphingobacterium sp. HJSM2_6 TaxID=3366264 RepID=UPI003BDB6571
MRFPLHCPSCDSEMKVIKLSCTSCETEVLGKFSLPNLSRLDVEDQEFIVQFLLNSGSLKEMAIKLGKSYPTVRNKLDDLIEKLKKINEIL